MTHVEQAQVTQADRDAARAAQADMIVGGFQGDKEVWRKVEQAFARHRTTSATELVEALEPFARCVEQIADSEDDEEWAKFRLLIGDYRRAARALSKLGGEETPNVR